MVAHGEGFLLGAQEHLLADGVAQLVGRGGDVEVGGGIAPGAALDGDDVEAGLGEFERHDRAGPAEADDDDVLLGQGGRVIWDAAWLRPARLTAGSV